MLKQTTFFVLLLVCEVYNSKAQTGEPGKNFNEISQAKNEYYNRVGKDKPGYKQFKRWEWYYSTRTGPGGVLLDNQQMNLAALRNSSANRSSLNAKTDANTGGWSIIGPTSVSSNNKGIGRINRIAFHPTNVNTLYVAGATGGLWITTDGGANWYSYSEGIPNMALSGVAVNYNNTAEIYILTGDADDGKRSNGVLKTYDGGFTWYRTSLRWTLDNNAFAYKLLMHPTNPALLMIPTSKGIFRTTNGGSTWDSTETGFHFYDMEFQPGNPSIVYACGRSSDSIIVMKSSNAGQTFTRTHAIRRLRNFDNEVSSNRSALAVTAANSSYVYLMTGPCTDAGEFQGFYRSTDIGETFTLRTNTPNILGGSSTGDNADDQEGYDMAVVASPTNANRVACGGIRLWTSTTGGTSFSFQDDYVSTLSYYHPDIHDLVYHPLDNTKLYMCG
ncbi:MAG TPA: hypothetical protein VM871_08990, partial [Flavisolibacter sp.]|nr:hypothetical protein [Flavisolibacter sp.]